MVIDISSVASIQLTIRIPGPLSTCGGRELIFASAAIASHSKPNVNWKHTAESVCIPTSRLLSVILSNDLKPLFVVKDPKLQPR